MQAKAYARFTGRREALRAAEDALAAALEGCGGTLVILGEAGVGKTRLVQRILENARMSGVRVARGHCFDDASAAPYGPWIHVNDDLRRVPAPYAMDELPPWPPPPARTARTAVPRGRTQRSGAHAAFARSLGQLAERVPLALALEDLQWADLDTLDLLIHVSRYLEGRRLLLIATCRPSDGASTPERLLPTLSALGRNTEYRRVFLHGFSIDELAEHLADEAGQPLDPALVKALYDETGGNPFYAHELFRSLAGRGATGEPERRWSADRDIYAPGVPGGVRDAVHHRLSRLTMETAQALRIASALERVGPASLVAAAIGEPEERATARLEEACAAGLLRRAGRHYEFSHPIVRRATYDTIPPLRRARLHRRIAEGLARIEVEAAAEIAVQYHRSREIPGADAGVPHAIAAAVGASVDDERVIALLKVARDLVRRADLVTRAHIALQMSVAESHDRRVDDALRSLDDAIHLMLVRRAPDVEVAQALAIVARALRESGAGRDVWVSLLERGLDVLGEERGLPWARLMLLLDRTEPLATGSIQVWRWIPSPPLALALARASAEEDDYVLTLSPYAARARADTGEALRVARSFQDRRAVVRALGSIAWDFMYQHHDCARARACLDELLAASAGCGSVHGQVEALVQRAICRAVTGDDDGSRRDADRAHDLAARIELTYRLRAMSRVEMPAALRYLRGEESGWEPIATEASRLSAPPVAKNEPHSLSVVAMAAFAHAMTGNRSVANRYLDALTPLFETTDPSFSLRGTAIDLGALTVWKLRRAALAERYLVLSEAGAGGEQSGVPITCKELNAARMALLLRRTSVATDYFGRARETLFARSQLAVLSLLDRETTDVAENLPHGLTRREVELLKGLATGLANKEIAAKLFISVATVERHIANIYAKIGIRSRAGAARYALLHKIVSDD